MSKFLVGLLIILINGFSLACTICSFIRNSTAVEDHNRTIYGWVFCIIKVPFCFLNYLTAYLIQNSLKQFLIHYIEARQQTKLR